MSIFDRLKQSAVDAAATAATAIGNKRETFTFAALPESLAQLQALPEAALDTPFQTAALTVLALCAYAADRHAELAAGAPSFERTGDILLKRPLP